MTDLGTLGLGFSRAFAINDSGHVVGDSGGHAFLWTLELGMIDLGTLGGMDSLASGCNNSGQVVGQSTLANGLDHAFLWTVEDGMIDLGAWGWVSFAKGINELGQVVGYGDTPGISPLSMHAFLWTAEDGMTDLGTLGGQKVMLMISITSAR